jgi:hypothetical protein
MRRRGLLAIVLTLFALTAPAAAQWRHPGYAGGQVRRLEGILPGIRSTYPGRFYDAEGPYSDAAGGLHYRIKWLTPEGRVIWLDADARTGRVIGPAGYPAPAPNIWRPEGAAPVGRFGPMPGGPAIGRGYPPRPGWGRPGMGGWPGRVIGRRPGR